MNRPVPCFQQQVEVGVSVGVGKVTSVRACRPHHFEEPQQVVETALQARSRASQVTVDVPPFRCHAMVALRIQRN